MYFILRFLSSSAICDSNLFFLIRCRSNREYWNYQEARKSIHCNAVSAFCRQRFLTREDASFDTWEKKDRTLSTSAVTAMRIRPLLRLHILCAEGRNSFAIADLYLVRRVNSSHDFEVLMNLSKLRYRGKEKVRRIHMQSFAIQVPRSAEYPMQINVY